MASNATMRNRLGQMFLLAPIVAFLICFAIGSSFPMFVSTYLLAHTPFLAAVVYSIFRIRSLGRVVLIGWVAWLFSAVLWEILYAALYKRFGWLSPDLPGEFLFGLAFGWIPAAIVAGIATVAKMILDRLMPVELNDHRNTQQITAANATE